MSPTIESVGLLDARAAAKYLGVSQRTLFTLSHPRGPVPVVRPTSWSVRYTLADLEAYVASRREASE